LYIIILKLLRGVVKPVFNNKSRNIRDIEAACESIIDNSCFTNNLSRNTQKTSAYNTITQQIRGEIDDNQNEKRK